MGVKEQEKEKEKKKEEEKEEEEDYVGLQMKNRCHDTCWFITKVSAVLCTTTIILNNARKTRIE